MSLARTAALLCTAILSSVPVSRTVAAEPPFVLSKSWASKKAEAAGTNGFPQERPGPAGSTGRALDDDADNSPFLPPGVVGPPRPVAVTTLFQVHTNERVVLDRVNPTEERFADLMADRVVGGTKPMDPRLIDLLRQLAEKFPNARIELVSGYRSEKLNEMLRKKGHNVATHSQHSLGHALDFRIIPDGKTTGIDPRRMESLLRSMGWEGGIGVYPRATDWFVHADVGPKRRWRGR